MTNKELDKKSIGAMRYIALRSIQEAGSGHVGMAISAAPITYTLFTRFININANDGKWINRDRFVLSAGHGAMALYPIFYLSGLLSKKEMKNFKMKGSKTPGHPEFERTKDNFIDASTGPLGQGLAMAVGMAMAQKYAQIKTDNEFFGLFSNYTYVVCGDGDLQEGISYEAMSIAGKYQLDKLIVLHDSNKFQLDSSVSKVSIDNLRLRAESMGWFYLKSSNDPDEIERNIKTAQASGKPSFIEVDTVIAEGLKVSSSNKGHHSTISEEDIKNFQDYFNLSFNGWTIDQEVIDHFKESIIERGKKAVVEWEKKVYNHKQKDSFKQIENIMKGKFDFAKLFNSVKVVNKDLSTRTYLKEFLSTLENKNNFALATCADLSSSTNVYIGDKTILEGGQSIPVGVREFVMSSIMNGIALYHDGFKIIGGTFLAFADYMKPAIRLSAMMKLPTIFVFTHDSYLVGGDGPTHQPYDQLAMLRAIDNVHTYRPADEEELRLSLIETYSSKTSTNVISLSKQNVKSINKEINPKEFSKGAYAVQNCKNADYVLAASGTEVSLALEVAKELKNVRVVSVPCLDKAIKLSDKELKELFSAKKALISIEASSDFKWFKLHLNNQNNIHLGAYTFGHSMDGLKLYEEKGFTKNSILKLIKKYE